MKKKRLPLIVTAVIVGLFQAFYPTHNTAAAGGNTGQKVSDADQAYLKIKKEISSHPSGPKQLFVSRTPIKGGTSIPSWGKTIKVPQSIETAWFFFVDDQPDANWGHHCRYIFVDIKTGRYSVISAQTPPDNWEQMIPISPGDKPGAE